SVALLLRPERQLAGALDDAVVVDGAKPELDGLEQPAESPVVVLIGVGDDGVWEGDDPARVLAQVEPPAEEADHIVRLPGVDKEEAVVRRDDERAVSLADIDEVDFEK